jgi:hypothetical protein
MQMKVQNSINWSVVTGEPLNQGPRCLKILRVILQQVKHRFWKYGLPHFVALLNRKFNNHRSDVCTEDNNEDFKTTKEEMGAAVDKLKYNKAPGTDNMQTELLKHGGQNILLLLHKLHDLVWIMEKMPDEWKTCIICPLYKQGDPLHCAYYRSIVLSNRTYKVFSKILY